jgi:beta-glucoside operon transcriptional antiterminator
MMHIDKILNNNVIITKDNGIEQVIMGRGIAFKRRIGDNIDESRIEKVFRLSNDNEMARFESLLSNLSLEVIEVADEIFHFAEVSLQKSLNELVYIAIVDHLSTALERQRQGIRMSNFLLWDIKRFFPREFEIGMKGVQMINERLNVDFGEEEAGFLTFHLLDGEMEVGVDEVSRLTVIMQEIMNLLKYYFHTEFDENSSYFSRFSTHLKYFAQQVVQNNEKTPQPTQVDDDLFHMVKKKYPVAYEAVEMIAKFLLERYTYRVSHGEKAFLTIHIMRILPNAADESSKRCCSKT